MTITGIIKDVTVERAVDYCEIGNGIVVYNDRIICRDEVVSEENGITEKENLDFKNIEPIKSNESYVVVTKETLDAWLKLDDTKFYNIDPWKAAEDPKNYKVAIYKQGELMTSGKRKRYYPKGYCLDVSSTSYDIDLLETYLKANPDRFMKVRSFLDREEYEEILIFTWLPTEKEYNTFMKNKLKKGRDEATKEIEEMIGISAFKKKEKD